MGKVRFTILMDRNMMVIGMKMFGMVVVHIHIQIMILMKGNGKIIKDMAKEPIHMLRQV